MPHINRKENGMSKCMKLLFAGAISMMASAAYAGCEPYSEVKKAVAEKYDEVPSGSGILESGNAVLMIFASPNASTWTAAILTADGAACVLMHGSDWEPVIPPEFSLKGRQPS
jgi:hypothetical protein